MRKKLLIVVALLSANQGLSAADPPVGTAAVEKLLTVCSDAGVIVTVKDPKTGKVLPDPQLGIPQFIVPDEAKLRATLKANKTIMQDVKSRQALIGCAKLAARDFAPGWVDLLRAVGREHDDPISVKIAYNIAADHDLPLGSRQGFADLKILINAAIEAGSVEFHPARPHHIAFLTIEDEAKFKSILEEKKSLLNDGLIGAAANMSRNKTDHTPILKAIAGLTKSPMATAYAAEYAAKTHRDDLKTLKVAEELEAASAGFAALLDEPSQARVLAQLGQVRRELGEEETALDLFNQAIRILNKVHDGKHRRLADLHRLKAEMFCDRNEVQRSLNSYMTAIGIFMSLKQDLGDFADTTNMMRLMARIDLLTGHDDDAREKLLDILFLLGEIDREKRPDWDTEPHRALVLRDIGILELCRKRADEAKTRLDASLAIQMRREGAVHPETIKTLFVLGQACAERKEPGQSEFLTRQAIIFLTHHYGQKHPALVKAWSDRTAVHVAQGNYRDAGQEIAYGLRAARITDEKATASADDYLPTRDTVLLLSRRGELSLRAADLDKVPAERMKSLQYALDHFVLAEAVFNRIRGNMPGTDDRLIAGDEAPDFFTGQLGCHVRLGKLRQTTPDREVIFALAERATARSLSETLGDDILSRLSGVPESLRDKHRQLRMNYEAALREHNRAPFQENQTNLSPLQRATWQKHLQTQKDLSEFQSHLAKDHPTPTRETGTAVCTLEQALALLEPNEVAVCFVMGDRESFAVVLSRGKNSAEVTAHSLSPHDSIANKVNTLLEPNVMDQAMGRELGDELYDRLLAPIGDRIAGKNLLIVPTGPLCLLPFELLRQPTAKGRQYLGLVSRIRYAPSLTVLRLLRERDRANRIRPELPVWVMASPEIRELPSLPQAAVEAKSVAALLKADPASVRVGRTATKTAIVEASAKGELKKHRILHFAVHAGFYASVMPGLVLGGDGKQDGFLDMDEVAHLNLNADLVVLSACSSAGGRIYRGEGVRGLTGSFLVAGSRAVIATQWPLADAGAAKFMESFYRRLQAGNKPADALWDTRREAATQAEPRPPSEWAAFILVGNP